MTDRPAADNTDDSFAEAVGARLRSDASHLDAATLSKLNQARQAALEAMPDPGRRHLPWLGAAVAAAAALLAVGLWRTDIQTGDAAPPALAAQADMDLLLGDEPLDMIEDLEFFAWLAAEELDAGASG